MSNNNVQSHTESDESPLAGESLTLNKPTSETNSELQGIKVQIKNGDRISCYPNINFFNREKPVEATVLKVHPKDGWFDGATIEWNSYKKVGGKWVRETITSEISGGSEDWILSKL